MNPAAGNPHPIEPVRFLQRLFAAAVAAAQPQEVLPAFLPPPPKGRTVVVGAGKAAAAMAYAFDAAWPRTAPLTGVVVTRYGFVPPPPASWSGRIAILEAAHPVPDAASVAAGQAILAAVQGLSADDLVVCLLSGGASALMCAPAPGLTLAEKQRLNAELLASGASIHEINTVRKHLSRLKGGRLAAACAPAAVLTLAISDVPGDDLSVIGSGPTVPDPTTCTEALAILQRYAIAVPEVMQTALRTGAWETPKPGEAVFARARAELIATPAQSLAAAARYAESQGLRAYVLGDAIEGEAREVAKVHAGIARAVAEGKSSLVAPCVLLSGGETSVTLKTPPDTTLGQGGRNSEFCLALALALNGHPRIWALAADTDGIDGSADNAGAVVTPTTLSRAQALGLSVRTALERHDAYGFFAALGDLFVTGPTHTNVNDFRAVLIH